MLLLLFCSWYCFLSSIWWWGSFSACEPKLFVSAEVLLLSTTNFFFCNSTWNEMAIAAQGLNVFQFGVLPSKTDMKLLLGWWITELMFAIDPMNCCFRYLLENILEFASFFPTKLCGYPIGRKWVDWCTSFRYPKAVFRGCFVKKVFLNVSQNSQDNTCVGVSFHSSFRPEACNFIKKETLVQVISCEFSEISPNTLFYRTPSVAASGFRSGKFLK